jgi:hypothetical protein
MMGGGEGKRKSNFDSPDHLEDIHTLSLLILIIQECCLYSKTFVEK